MSVSPISRRLIASAPRRLRGWHRWVCRRGIGFRGHACFLWLLCFQCLLCLVAAGSHALAAPAQAHTSPTDVTNDSDTAPAEALQQLLRTHCADCHSADLQEADVRLDHFATIPGASREALLNRVEEQIYLQQMPPSDAAALSPGERERFQTLVTRNYAALGTRSLFQQKKQAPGFGNAISHEKLFSGDITTPAYSPARLWRTSPFVFDQVKSQHGGDPRRLRQPFVVDDKTGIRDYAALLFADSAVVDVLMSNAAKVAEQLLETDPLCGRLASAEAPPEDLLLQIIDRQFARVVYREPTAAERTRYGRLISKTAATSGAAEALRITLMAVMLHHESVYRVEIGLGPADEHGRRQLSATELAFALSFALTDAPPDATLLQAVRDGRLHTRDDVNAQVTRLLQDPSIRKPRILRFFQEFFGYVHAHKVFKDAMRSGGFSYYGENYPEMYERDADFFVMKILDRDQDVFRQLLTSDRYYILNRQTFRNTVYDFWRQHEEQIEQDQMSEEMTRDLLARLDLRNWGELNRRYNLHNFNKGFNGSARAIRQIVKECRQWKNTEDEDTLRHGMQPLYRKYPMVYDLQDDEQDFLLPQPYQRPHRAGMLTHPAWLIAHSLNDSTDPIRRGKWIRERLLAGVVPDLPITVDATIPEDHHKTLRERLSVTEADACWRCHQQMNPLGYPFEIYDDFGRYRTQETLDKLARVDGQFPARPIDAATTLVGSGDPQLDGPVTDALDLIERLAKSDRVRQSITRHAFRYFLGRNEMLSDSQTLLAADRAYVDSGGSFRALLTSLLTSDSFLYRK